ELARAFAREQPAVALYFVAVAGEEQGLVGSAHLARRLKQEGVEVLAMTSVDIAGNVEGQNGVVDNTRGRLYSEGTPVAETEAQKRLREALGGENDSASREWARYVQRLGERYVENLDLLLMLRRDVRGQAVPGARRRAGIARLRPGSSRGGQAGGRGQPGHAAALESARRSPDRQRRDLPPPRRLGPLAARPAGRQGRPRGPAERHSGRRILRHLHRRCRRQRIPPPTRFRARALAFKRFAQREAL